MHPASSIIIFTTLSGAGFGLMALLGLGFGRHDPAYGLAVASLALALACGGLTASLFHLGNPQRAWRALSQWRTSWLSREGVLALATFGAFTLYIVLWLVGFGRSHLLGAVVALLALATVYATAMIYASIKAVPRWAKSPTRLLFLSCALSGGAIALAVTVLPFGRPASPILFGTGLLLAAAGGALAWWTVRAHGTPLGADGSTPETAFGHTGPGAARLFEAPHTAPNYLNKEMVFRIGRKHAAKLRRIAFWAGFVLPLLLIMLTSLAPSSSPILPLALPLHLIGVAVSRWLFFAEAEHVVALYYGYR